MRTKLQFLEEELQSLTERGVETQEKIDLILEIAEHLVSGENPKRLLSLASEALELAERLSYDNGIAKSLLYLGAAYLSTADYEATLASLYRAKSLCERLEDQTGIAIALGAIGCGYRSLGNYDLSLSNLVESIKYFQTTGKQNKYWGGIFYYNLGTTYFELGDYGNSIDYYQKCLEAAAADGTKWQEARALNGIGNAYQSLGYHEDARAFYLQSLELFKESENQMGVARALNDLGCLYLQLGKTEEALRHHQESLQIREEIGQRQAQATTLINVGKVFIAQKQAPEAIEVLGRALAIAEEVKSKPKIYQAHLAFSQAHELAGDFAKSLHHFKVYQKIKEEVFSDQTNTRIKNLQTSFAVDQAEKETEIARLKNVELKHKNEQLEQLLNELKAAQTELIHAEKMVSLGKLVAGICHEINSPLGVVSSTNDVNSRCVERLVALLEECLTLEELKQNSEFQKALRVLKNNTDTIDLVGQRVASIMKSLKSFARLDEAEFGRVNLHEGLNNTLTLIRHELAEGIQIVKQYGELAEIYGYPGDLNQIFITLLRNAVQSIEKEGVIRIKTAATGETASVEISDTGRGIPPEELPSIFDFRFTAQESRVKLGMGLPAAYNIAKKHQGELKAVSEVGKGTTFTLNLPTDLESRLQSVTTGQPRNKRSSA